MADRLNDSAESFTAPVRPAAPRGAASPEAMERLQRAVQRDPAAAPRRAPEPQPEAPRGPSRMAGLGRMMERLAGHHEAPAERPQPGTLAERVSERMARARQPDVEFDNLASPGQGDENVEIPAFLRRQAN